MSAKTQKSVWRRKYWIDGANAAVKSKNWSDRANAWIEEAITRPTAQMRV